MLLSLFLATLLTLLLFLLFFLDNSSRHPETIVFLKVIILVNITADEEVWVDLLELVKEGIIYDRDGCNVKVGQLWQILNNLLKAELGDCLALDQFKVLQLRDILENQLDREITKR